MSDPVAYLRISEGEPLPDVSGYAPFRAVIAAEIQTSTQWRNEVGDWLVRQGCLFAMAWGQDCSHWHDAVDWANIMAFDPNPVPDEAHVMTTWHEDQSLEEVFWEAQFCANDPRGHIEHSLIVHVGSVDSASEFLALYAQAETLADRETSPPD